jgi:hypothetical protein
MATIALVVLPLVGGASAQSPAPGAAAPDGFPLTLDLSPPADTGKPRPFAVHPSEPQSDCTAAFDCRVRVIGTIRRDGAVELNATALKW